MNELIPTHRELTQNTTLRVQKTIITSRQARKKEKKSTSQPEG
jgi:hypothetical protein